MKCLAKHITYVKSLLAENTSDILLFSSNQVYLYGKCQPYNYRTGEQETCSVQLGSKIRPKALIRLVSESAGEPLVSYLSQGIRFKTSECDLNVI